jgi:hypothetical protein
MAQILENLSSGKSKVLCNRLKYLKISHNEFGKLKPENFGELIMGLASFPDLFVEKLHENYD